MCLFYNESQRQLCLQVEIFIPNQACSPVSKLKWLSVTQGGGIWKIWNLLGCKLAISIKFTGVGIPEEEDSSGVTLLIKEFYLGTSKIEHFE